MTNKYAGLITNDFTNGEGVCVSFFTQGCPHHCPDCWNPETWDFNGGKDIPTDLIGEIIKAISKNGIQRNFSILGGEPMCKENLELVKKIVTDIRIAYPNIKIYLWSGYTFDQLLEKAEIEKDINIILEKIDILIDGPYDKTKRDITLKLRGSTNQHIREKINNIWTIVE